MNNLTDKSNLIKFSTRVFTKLMLGASFLFFMLSTSKVLAYAPNMYIGANAIPVSFNECKNRAHKTANLLFRRIANRNGDGNVYYLLVRTGNIVGVIQCSRHPKGSSFTVVTSSKYSNSHAEAQSLRTRMANVMLGRI
ncbi:hypothetical protein IQ247_06940 [Plectonema cf. radiosum LEGE 06105]|uniref:Uncharacterized protein n=1 Tax=Plectonema cf. radiosum LEGE 06105 TaxID=945769 RepID=A0A8J7F6P6_9CYAN|nr:hypothetical protein [Plectonema radiosum]MBE9212449.1 hypothetical protein [Plectonema cf. radiosum LEGE 06105]